MGYNKRKTLWMSLLIILWGVPYAHGIIFSLVFLGEKYFEVHSIVKLQDTLYWVWPVLVFHILYLLGTLWCVKKIEQNWDFTNKRYLIAQGMACLSMCIWGGFFVLFLLEHYNLLHLRIRVPVAIVDTLVTFLSLTGSMIVFSVWYTVLVKKRPKTNSLYKALSYAPLCIVFTTPIIIFFFSTADCLDGCPETVI